MKERVVKISAGMTGEFEVIKTDATDEIIELQLKINNKKQENDDIIDDPYNIIKDHGFNIKVLGSQDDLDLNEINVNKEFDLYEYGNEIEVKEEVKVYTDCLNADYMGDLVRCMDCGELMLIQIGGSVCGECESENLTWYDNNKPEWNVKELEDAGFIIIEK